MIVVSLSTVLVSDPAPYMCVCVCGEGGVSGRLYFLPAGVYNISWVSSASASKCCDCLKVGYGHFFCLLSTYNSHVIPQFDDTISVKAFLNKQRHDMSVLFPRPFLLNILIYCHSRNSACDFWDLNSCVVKEYFLLRYDAVSLVKRFLYRLTSDKALHPRRMGSSDIA
jgi:hypothetical protein